MDKELRNKIRATVVAARRLLEEDAAKQLEGTYGIYKDDGRRTPPDKLDLNGAGLQQLEEIHRALDHEQAKGRGPAGAVWRFTREVAFTHLNRLVALRLFEDPSRGLIRESIAKGDQSQGFKEFQKYFPAFRTHDEDGGYRRYLELLEDEAASEVRILFDRSTPHSILFPKPATLKQVLALLHDEALAVVWSDDETLGWVYQYFNGDDKNDIRDPKNTRTKGKPQTSEDLAIINQFFTPNYVVRFLVENTLGRLWWEMRPDTPLVSEWEYLIFRPGEKPPAREPKTPEEIKVLDPAVGSGHFLLYCFDVLARIYETEGYDKKEIPGLILKHNLHGIDIDSRASQIAALSLYLKAKKYHPEAVVTTTNIVDAEPLPDDKETLDAFVAGLPNPLVRRVVPVIWKELQLAGHVGSLLKVDETLQEIMRPERGGLDAWGAGEFWGGGLQTVYDALHAFYQEAEASGSIERRLFAAEGEQGFRFLNVLRQRYDVVVMNPPFGDGTPPFQQYLKENYPVSEKDLYAAFVERALDWTRPDGYLGAITNRTGFFLSTMESWRRSVLGSQGQLACMADLGYGVLDALVETTAFVLRSAAEEGQHVTGRTKAFFVRLLSSSKKAEDLAGAVADARVGKPNTLMYEQSPTQFESVPGAAYCYWVSEGLLAKFKTLPEFKSRGREIRQGLATADDFRFVRCWWEVREHLILAAASAPGWKQDQDGFLTWCREATNGHTVWAAFAKGGSHGPYYVDPHLVVKWQNNGREIRGFTDPHTGKLRSRPQNLEYFFRPGITWPKLPLGRGPFGHVPPGAIFSHAGMMIFPPLANHWSLLALLNSDAYVGMLHLLMPRGTGETGATLKYEVGYVASVPIPDLSPGDTRALSTLAERGFALQRSFDTINETSHAFWAPALLQVDGHSFEARVAAFGNNEARARHELTLIQQEVNAIAFDAYGISEADQAALCEGLPLAHDRVQQKIEISDDDAEDVPVEEIDASTLGRQLLSYGVGCAFGRWDIRLALPDRPPMRNSEPFDPLPATPPALLSRDGGPAPEGYPLEVPERGILVDDPGHQWDIAARAQQVFSVLFGDRARAFEEEALRALGEDNLRTWLTKRFFDIHTKRYSMSRRKAPIYWQLASPRGSYSVWIHAPNYRKDTLHYILEQYVRPRIALEERRIEDQRRALEVLSGQDRRRREKDAQAGESFLAELRDFQSSLLEVAKLNLDPDSDDGVILNLAPLHKLVPWKGGKGPRQYWDDLLKGQYSWSTISKQLKEAGLVE